MDFNHQLRARAPFVFAFVLGLAFVLLMWSFRSIVIAATGVVLNLLSVGAAYGVLVAVFQWGWGKSLLGFDEHRRDHLVAAAVPVRDPARAVDGLPRVHRRPGSRRATTAACRPAEAIHDGIVRSAGVITSAAIVMVFVFLTFATLNQTSLKQLGVGLAVAVLLDATVVRAMLLPGDHEAARRAQLVPAARARPRPVRARGRPSCRHRCPRADAAARRRAQNEPRPCQRAGLSPGLPGRRWRARLARVRIARQCLRRPSSTRRCSMAPRRRLCIPGDQCDVVADAQRSATRVRRGGRGRDRADHRGGARYLSGPAEDAAAGARALAALGLSSPAGFLSPWRCTGSLPAEHVDEFLRPLLAASGDRVARGERALFTRTCSTARPCRWSNT